MNIPLHSKTNIKHCHIKTKRRWVVVVELVILTGLLLYVGTIIGYNIPRQDQPVAATVAPTVDPAPDPLTLWLLVNEQRVKAHLSPLELDSALDTTASDRCNDMVSQDYWDHTNPQGRTPQDFIQANFQHDIRQDYSGENLSVNYTGADVEQAIVNGWMNSPEHAVNILNPHYTRVGYEVCSAPKYKNIVVQDFLSGYGE